MKHNSQIPNLAGHFEGVKPEDLLLIAFHNGTAYSVTSPSSDFFDIDTELVDGLKKHIARGEFVSRLSRTGRNG